MLLECKQSQTQLVKPDALNTGKGVFQSVSSGKMLSLTTGSYSNKCGYEHIGKPNFLENQNLYFFTFFIFKDAKWQVFS